MWTPRQAAPRRRIHTQTRSFLGARGGVSMVLQTLPLHHHPKSYHMPRLWYLILVICIGISRTGADVFLNKWAVHIAGSTTEAEQIAREHGFTSRGQIGTLENYYLFEHHAVSRRSTEASAHHVHLAKHPKVRWLEQQVAKRRVKRDLDRPAISVTDPLWDKQWYLHGGATGGFDMNIIPAWRRGYTGRGVVVTILDDGIEHNHQDLKPNYDPQASYDINDQDRDPMPRYDGTDTNRHGTRCAGEVSAVANNTKCVVGVAYNAKIGGVRMLDGDVSDHVEAESLSLNPQHIDIYSASWGPDDNGKVVDGPAKLAKEAFIQGILKGRNGKGSIFVWASGNGGSQSDSCNCDGYTNSLFTLSISSVSERGRKPWYLEECSSTLATTYSSGENYGDKKIVTTDLHGECTEAHTGTSASAPLAAGICALALEANPELTWRDMQYIVMRTARPEPLLDGDWTVNGVGRKVSHKYGYGLMDAAQLVNLAERWTTVPEQHICTSPIIGLNTNIDSEGLQVHADMDSCVESQNYVRYMEHVQAKVTLHYSRRGDIQLHLVSPNGTRSMLLQKRKNDYQLGEFRDWPFMSVHYWGEDPTGKWTLEVENVGSPLNTGTLVEWQLIVYGVSTDPVQLREPRTRPPPTEPTTVVTTTSSDSSSHVTTGQDKPPEGSASGGGVTTDGNKELKTDADLIDAILNGDDEDGASEPSIPETEQSVKDNGQSEYDVDEGGTEKGAGKGLEDKVDDRKGDQADNTENESWLPSKEWHLDTDAQVLCHKECESKRGCSGPGPSDCRTCIHVRLETDGPCVGSCPMGSYPDGDTGLCAQCNPTCRECTGAYLTNCLTCPHGYYLLETNHTCLDVCPPGFLQDDDSWLCRPCMLPCRTCSGKPDHCLTCQPDWDLVRHTCHPNCQLYYFRQNDRCEPCSTNCEVCVGPQPSDCAICGHEHVLQNGTCVATCDDGFFLASTNHGQECLRCAESCVTCSSGGEGDCESCGEGLTLHLNQCLQICPAGHFKSSTGSCESCDPSCHSCNGQSGYDCTSCPEYKYLYNGECLDACPEGHFPPPDGSTAAVCDKCAPSCLTCETAAELCTGCGVGLRLDGHTCILHCLPSEFHGREGCEPCHPSCSTCSGPGEIQCTSCSTSHHIHQGACMSACPLGFYSNDGHCQKCFNTCKTCSGAGENSCLSCNDSHVPRDGACLGAPAVEPTSAASVVQCSAAQFLNTTAQRCAPCDESCETCDGWGPYRCTTCRPPRRYYSKTRSCVLCCSEAVSHSCCSCHPKTGVCMENRNIDYDNIPPTEPRAGPAGQDHRHLSPPRVTVPCRTVDQQLSASPRAGVVSLVVMFCVFSLLIFFVVFGVLQARSSKRVCWYRHYQPVPLYYQQEGTERGTQPDTEPVTLSKRDYEDEDSVSSV